MISGAGDLSRMSFMHVSSGAFCAAWCPTSPPPLAAVRSTFGTSSDAFVEDVLREEPPRTPWIPKNLQIDHQTSNRQAGQVGPSIEVRRNIQQFGPMLLDPWVGHELMANQWDNSW